MSQEWRRTVALHRPEKVDGIGDRLEILQNVFTQQKSIGQEARASTNPLNWIAVVLDELAGFNWPSLELLEFGLRPFSMMNGPIEGHRANCCLVSSMSVE